MRLMIRPGQAYYRGNVEKITIFHTIFMIKEGIEGLMVFLNVCSVSFNVFSVKFLLSETDLEMRVHAKICLDYRDKKGGKQLLFWKPLETDMTFRHMTVSLKNMMELHIVLEKPMYCC